MSSAWWSLMPLPVASALLTAALRKYALLRRLFDVPNERSSHDSPKPRGAGLSVVLTFLGAVLVFSATGRVPPSVAAALLGGGTAVAAIGFLDDHRSVPPLLRLWIHFLASVWIVYSLGGFPPAIVAAIPYGWPWLRNLAAVIGLMWLINLYNFMDGIDGIAALEAVTTGACAAILLFMWHAATTDWILSAALALSTAGFLVWNWPPSKVFMGDVGSGFLGCALAVLVLSSSALAARYFWIWGILLGVFVVDATMTLLRRLFRGDPIHLPHRTHAYQHAARDCGSHLRVILAVGAINLCWLFPVALAVQSNELSGPVGLMIAYAPLVAIGRHYRAGTSR